MFEKLKFWIKKENQEKHVIVCIHGFGTKRTHEYDNFKIWGEGKYHLYPFDIYVLESEEDYRPEIWIHRCESSVEAFLNAGYKVDIIGYSMGGVLASHVAAKYDINRLFLVSPAFEYLNAGNILSSAKDWIKPKNNNVKNKPSIPIKYTQCFMEVVRLCKEDISKVKCPVCIVHGDKDEVISYKSSINAFDKIPHSEKRLFLIHNGTHHLINDEQTGNEVYQLFSLFMDGILLPMKSDISDEI